MLDYTNLETEKDLLISKILKENGILKGLKTGIEDGDTVKLYGWELILQII